MKLFRRVFVAGLAFGLGVGAAIVVVAAADGRTNAGSVASVIVLNGTANTSTTLSAPTDVAGMQTTITVPGLDKVLLDLRYSSESACFNSTGFFQWCTIQILVDGVPAGPTNGSALEFAYDSTSSISPGAFDGWRSLAMERFVVVSPGRHTIDVESLTTDTTDSTTVWQGERTLVISRSKYLSGVLPTVVNGSPAGATQSRSGR